jgi:hypothetical protein
VWEAIEEDYGSQSMAYFEVARPGAPLAIVPGDVRHSAKALTDRHIIITVWPQFVRRRRDQSLC